MSSWGVRRQHHHHHQTDMFNVIHALQAAVISVELYWIPLGCWWVGEPRSRVVRPQYCSRKCYPLNWRHRSGRLPHLAGIYEGIHAAGCDCYLLWRRLQSLPSLQ